MPQNSGHDARKLMTAPTRFMKELGSQSHVGASSHVVMSIPSSSTMAESSLGRSLAVHVVVVVLVCVDVMEVTVEVTDVPIVVKLTPNVADIVGMAQAVAEAGAAGVSLINTITGMAIDVRKRRPRLATTYGGLSGPAIKPVALRMVHQVHKALPDLPVCGMGGITSGEDALEYLMAGASCLQVGTANFAEPPAALRVLDELRSLLAELGFKSVREAVGALEPIPAEVPYETPGQEASPGGAA